MFSSILKPPKKIPLGGEILHLFSSARAEWLVFPVIDYRPYHPPPLKLGTQRGGDATALDKGSLSVCSQRYNFRPLLYMKGTAEGSLSSVMSTLVMQLLPCTE